MSTTENNVVLRDVEDSDLAIFFEHQRDPGANHMVAFTRREFWGQGIATAALSQLLELETRRPLFAGVAKDNLGSIRVLEKCGFAIISEKRAFAKARGEEIDDLVMRLD